MVHLVARLPYKHKDLSPDPYESCKELGTAAALAMSPVSRRWSQARWKDSLTTQWAPDSVNGLVSKEKLESDQWRHLTSTRPFPKNSWTTYTWTITTLYSKKSNT